MKYTPQAAVIIANRYLQPGDTVLEVGAADGAHTAIYAARVGPSGCVLAVEPFRRHLDILRAIGPMVRVWHGAASDHCIAGAPFFENALRPMAGTLIDAHSADAIEACQVPLATIDALIDTLQHAPRLIHIDAQGSEAAILRGASHALSGESVWIIEVWPAGLRAAGATAEEVLQPFESRGYVPHDVRGRHMTWEKVRQETERRQQRSYGDLMMVPATMLVAA